MLKKVVSKRRARGATVGHWLALRTLPSTSARSTRSAAPGFTLVELMVVVLITGILATLGFAAVRKHVSAAWSAEALNMVQSIRAAEERWRSEHMMYLDVSEAGESWFPVDPRASENYRTESPFFLPPNSHTDAPAWLALRPTVAGPVRFGYKVNAGPADAPMTEPDSGPAITWPTPTDNWYVIQAIGDTDWDGTASYYRASSLDGEVYVDNPGE